MVEPPNLRVTIDLRPTHADLPPEQLDRLTTALFQELKSLDEVEQVERVPDPNPPAGGMGGGALIGLLTAEISVNTTRQVVGYLTQKFSSKPIDLEVEVTDSSRKIKLTGVRPEDLDKVVAAAERLAAGQDQKHG